MLFQQNLFCAAAIAVLASGNVFAEADAPQEAEAAAPRDAAIDEEVGGGDPQQEAIPPSLPQLPESQRPSIKAWVDRRKVGLGETLELFVEIRRRPGQRLLLPSDASFGGLDLVGKSVETIDEAGGWKKDRYRFTLLALSPGATQVPPLRFSGVTESGEVIHVESSGIDITVTDPTEGVEKPQLKDVAGVVPVYRRNYILLYSLGIIAGACLLLSFVWYLARNWERWHPKAPIPPPPPRPPEEVAFEKLTALAAALPLAPEAKKDWYIGLADMMREYLGNRFDFDALESTTHEIIEEMKRQKAVGIVEAQIWKFLTTCDMVKFAKYLPSADEDSAMLEEARRMVEASTQMRQQQNAVTPPAKSKEHHL